MRRIARLVSHIPPRGVCLVLGAGSGVGGNVAEVFAENGMTTALVRRDADKLRPLIDEIEANGGRAEAFGGFDITKEEEVTELVHRVETELGPIEAVVYNIGAQTGPLPLESTEAWKFKRAWELGALGAFLVARAVAPLMAERTRGTIIFTSSTAAFRGNKGQAAHAAAMGARRLLAQSLCHELGPQGVHVVHVLLDGMVVSPGTLGKMWDRFSPDGSTWEETVERKRAEESIIEPRAVGEEYWRLHQQPRSSWTFEVDLRPWTDKAWFHA